MRRFCYMKCDNCQRLIKIYVKMEEDDLINGQDWTVLADGADKVFKCCNRPFYIMWNDTNIESTFTRKEKRKVRGLTKGERSKLVAWLL